MQVHPGVPARANLAVFCAIPITEPCWTVFGREAAGTSLRVPSCRTSPDPIPNPDPSPIAVCHCPSAPQGSPNDQRTRVLQVRASSPQANEQHKGDSPLLMQILILNLILWFRMELFRMVLGVSTECLEALRCTQAEIHGPTCGCVATHLINFLIDPIPANKCLDVAPNQEGGENQEDEEPGEQESQAHAAEKEGEEVPTAALQTRVGRKACGDLPGQLRPRGSLRPGTPALPGKGPQEPGVPGSGAAVPELSGRSHFSQTRRRRRWLQKTFPLGLFFPRLCPSVIFLGV